MCSMSGSGLTCHQLRAGGLFRVLPSRSRAHITRLYPASRIARTYPDNRGRWETALSPMRLHLFAQKDGSASGILDALPRVRPLLRVVPVSRLAKTEE